MAPIFLAAVTSLIAYWIISKGYLALKQTSASGYLTGQITWGKIPLPETLKKIYHSIGTIVLGKSIFFNTSYLIVLIGIATSIVYEWFVKKEKVLYLSLYFFALFLTPFLLTIFIGNSETIRAKMPSIQLVIGFGMYYLYSYTLSSKLSKIVVFLSILLCFNQGVVTSNLLYSENIKYQNDVSIANRIASQIDGKLTRPYSNYTIVVAGDSYYPSLVNFEKRGEVLGRSFFEFDQKSKERWSTSYRVANFMQTLGYGFKAPNIEQTNRVQDLSNQYKMTVWPEQGSVYIDEINNLIIIKMSEYEQ